MFQVKLTESDLHNLSYQGRIALAGKYSEPEQWLYRDAYEKCHKIYDLIKQRENVTSAKIHR
jgi:hypothetical protein